MKRMNVREFRAKVSELHEEPIEVVRYSETVGYWIPIEMTVEPPKASAFRTKPAIAKAFKITSTMSKAEVDATFKKLQAEMDEIARLTAKLK